MSNTGIMYQLNPEDKELSNKLIDYTKKFEKRFNRPPDKLICGTGFDISKLSDFPFIIQQLNIPKTFSG